MAEFEDASISLFKNKQWGDSSCWDTIYLLYPVLARWVNKYCLAVFLGLYRPEQEEPRRAEDHSNIIEGKTAYSLAGQSLSCLWTWSPVLGVCPMCNLYHPLCIAQHLQAKIRFHKPSAKSSPTCIKFKGYKRAGSRRPAVPFHRSAKQGEWVIACWFSILTSIGRNWRNHLRRLNLSF